MNTIKLKMLFLLLFLVEDMIKEVDADGDGRIDFLGKFQHHTKRKQRIK